MIFYMFLDILCTQSDSFRIDLEAQGEESYKYRLPRRSLYYAYRLIAGQQNHSLGFQDESYDDILDVRSVWICLRHAKKKDNCWLGLQPKKR